MARTDDVERVVYDTWDGGFKSKLRKQGLNNKQYTSLNMHVYENGSLGPRPWWKLQNTTGLNTSETLDNAASIQWRPIVDDSAGQLWVHAYSNDVWVYDLTAGTWATGASEASGIDTIIHASTADPSWWGSRHGWDSGGLLVGGGNSVITPEDAWVYSGEAHITAAGTATQITWTDQTGSDAMTSFTLYRDRIWGWQSPNAATDNPNRIYYTNAASYTTSDAGNYIDIGAASSGYYILGAWALRDSLLICMSNGDWYAFTGTPGSGSLRFVGNYVTPAHGACGTVLNNMVYFLAPYGRQVCVATPSGVDTTSLKDIRPYNNDLVWDTFHDYRGLSSPREQSVLLPTLRATADQWFDALEFVNGSWSYSGFGRSRFTDSTSNMGHLRDCAVIAEGKAYAFVMEDPDAPSSHEMQLYTRDIVLNRPSSNTLDTWSHGEEVAAGASTTAVSKGAVRLAPFAPPGEEVRVRQVIVDFDYWKDVAEAIIWEVPDMRCSLTDGGALELESIDTFSATNLSSLSSLGYPSGNSSTIGAPSRWVFRFPLEDQQFLQQIQVQIDDIVSIAIQRIIVDYEVRPDNHWAGQTAGT